MKRPNKNINKNGQSGVTLLLTIMILTAITTTVLSIAAVALNEIRTSNDLVNSEPAITGAEAVGEDYMFQIIRGIATGCSVSTPTSTLGNNVQVSTTIGYYNSNPYSFSLAASANKLFLLYKPCDQTANPGYTSITITMANASGATAAINLCSWTSTTCSTSGDVNSTTFLNSGTVTWALTSTTKYQLYIANTDGVAENFTITTANSDPTVTGLPSGNTTLITTGTKNGVTRKLQTTIPH